MKHYDDYRYYQTKVLDTIVKIHDLLEYISKQGVPQPIAQDRWLDNTDMMQTFKIGRTKLYELKRSGLLTPRNLDGKDFYLEAEVVKFLKKQ